MTTAQVHSEPAHPLSLLRRPGIDSSSSLPVPAATVAFPVAQARSPQRSSLTARATSARDDQSGALPSRGITPAEGRVRASSLG